MWSTKAMVALPKSVKGGTYGIPDSSCRRIDVGALRGNHRGLFETTRMVIANATTTRWRWWHWRGLPTIKVRRHHHLTSPWRQDDEATGNRANGLQIYLKPLASQLILRLPIRLVAYSVTSPKLRLGSCARICARMTSVLLVYRQHIDFLLKAGFLS
jgi:hypothetical protein